MFDKIKSVMLGHAVGDALGVPVEFRSRDFLKTNPVTQMMGFGTHDVPVGCWSDDTSMALCALDSLANGVVDYDDIMRNFGKWYYDGEFTPTGVVFDIGNTCRNAINNYFKLNYSIKHCGLSDIKSNGNGSLMRIHPFVLYAYYNDIEDEEKFVNMISTASSLTHAHQCSIDGCLIYAYVLKELLNNPSKDSVYNGLKKAKSVIDQTTTHYSRLINNGIDVDVDKIKSSGYVVDTLEAAIWCLLTTYSYDECVLKAVNLGDDTDTVAAIAGCLAGALYGMKEIPNVWLNVLKKKDYIEDMCNNACNTWRIK